MHMSSSVTFLCMYHAVSFNSNNFLWVSTELTEFNYLNAQILNGTSIKTDKIYANITDANA